MVTFTSFQLTNNLISPSGAVLLYIRVDLPNDNYSLFNGDGALLVATPPVRVTPPGAHCFTPAAMNHGNRIVVATRRKGDNNYRHIEIFNVESKEFYPVTQVINPNFHHYNPFVSPESTFLGYHRFRGGVIPHLEQVISPVPGLRMLRLSGFFPAFSPEGDFIALNLNFEDVNAGLKIIKSDGTKRWTLLENRSTFNNSWNPADDKNVIFTSIGSPFQSSNATVQIARVTFDLENLKRMQDDDRDKVHVDIKILTKEETGNNAFPSSSPDGTIRAYWKQKSLHS